VVTLIKPGLQSPARREFDISVQLNVAGNAALATSAHGVHVIEPPWYVAVSVVLAAHVYRTWSVPKNPSLHLSPHVEPISPFTPQLLISTAALPSNPIGSSHLSSSQPVWAPSVSPSTVTPKWPSAHRLHSDNPASSAYSFGPTQDGQTSILVELAEAAALNDPAAHGSHSGSDSVVPAVLVKWPAPQAVCDVHVSVAVELVDDANLNIPDEHTSQSGCAVVLPATLVKVPATHLV
jgi:hypothetical protein